MDAKTPVRDPDSANHRAADIKAPKTGLTLQEYAALKGLPINFLKGEGLVDSDYFGNPAVQIPYLNELGNEVAVRFRGSFDGENQFWWKPQTKPVPYGLWHLEQARERGYIVIVEGESDCHTLWFHEFPALGVPGTKMWRREWDQYLDGIPEIYVVIEPDAGGEALMRKLAHSGIQDRMRMIHLGRVKDPSGLYLEDREHFQLTFEEAIANATPCPTLLTETNGQKPPTSTKEHIDEGSRNNELFRLGCRLRRASLLPEEIRATLLAVNTIRCRPPLPESEVADISKSLSK